MNSPRPRPARPPFSHLAEHLVALRSAARMSQRALAAAAVVSRGTVQRAESGTTAPSPAVLDALVGACGGDRAARDRALVLRNQGRTEVRGSSAASRLPHRRSSAPSQTSAPPSPPSTNGLAHRPRATSSGRWATGSRSRAPPPGASSGARGCPPTWGNCRRSWRCAGYGLPSNSTTTKRSSASRKPDAGAPPGPPVERPDDSQRPSQRRRLRSLSVPLRSLRIAGDGPWCRSTRRPAPRTAPGWSRCAAGSWPAV
ncbi:helix-turn-helix domain-containing protein [Streptomyces sp. NPDC006476]|uniref:helix-turn-helix domain-containing protein n=1 Tax=Streptomyces sp. NPDC006476 TaxID=3157175 RepID=UPI0033A106D8